MGGTGTNPEVVQALVANHRRFLAFVERRVGDRARAEDILQAAFVRGLEKSGGLREAESAVPWFYRLLRNALVDHYRRAAVERRRFPGEGGEVEPAIEAEDLRGEVCACIQGLLLCLKPEYAQLVRSVDLEEQSLGAVAERLGITRNNATVRLHRARRVLRRQLQRSCGTCADHGCLDCGCQRARHGSGDAL